MSDSSLGFGRLGLGGQVIILRVFDSEERQLQCFVFVDAEEIVKFDEVDLLERVAQDVCEVANFFVVVPSECEQLVAPQIEFRDLLES